ncbi:MAG: adenosylcobinamide-GDP ribazoletransferase [Ilumatobacter sp.]
MALPALGFFAAVQFLTRIPIRLRTAPELSGSVPWFPVVGALVGATVGGVAAGLGELVPATVAATLAVLVGVTVTGAFHEDGLADTCDAMGGWSQDQRRAILKDSRHGSYGVAAMCGTILLRVVALAALGPAAAFGGAVAAHTLGRGAAVAAMGLGPAVPTEGLGADYARALSPFRTLAGVVVSVALAGLAVGWWVAPLAIGVAIAGAAVTWFAVRAFGGVSGDVLGAIEQVGECVVLVIVTGLATRHTLWWA